MCLLLVEDNVVLVEELLLWLQQVGYVVDWLVDGWDVSICVYDENYDIVVLDLGLLGCFGFDVFKDWCVVGLLFCVLILMVCDSFVDCIIGL